MLRRCISVFVILMMFSVVLVSLNVIGAETINQPELAAEAVSSAANGASENPLEDALISINSSDASSVEAAPAENIKMPEPERNTEESVIAAVANQESGADTTFDFSQYDFSDPSNRNPDFPSDEEFFGVWDESKGEFTTKGHLNYDYVSSYGYDLLDVLAAVKQGDYDTAKAEILEYYRNVTNARGLEDVSTDDRQTQFKSDLLLQNFHYNPGGGEVADIFYLTGEYSTVNVEMTDQVQRIQSLGGEKLMNLVVYAVNKDDYEAEFFSREAAAGGPVLEVVINGTAVTFTPTADGYVGAGDNRNTCFASTDPQRLLARESSIGNLNPVDSDTRRSYIMFDLSRIGDGDEITSATLRLRGKWNDMAEIPRNDPTYQKRMTILVNQETSWSENAEASNALCYAYSGTQSYAFSYDGEFGTNWRQPDTECNPAFRFEEELFRFSSWFDKLATTYRTTEDETYAQAAFMFLHDFIEKTYSVYRGMPGTIYETPAGDANSIRLLYGGYSKGLDLHQRSSTLPLWMPHFMNSESLTPELFTVILKYMWSMGNVHSTYWTTSEDGNWGSAATAGFFRVICYYPEFAEIPEWNEILMGRMNNFNKTFLRADGSSTEGSISYTAYTLSTMLRNKETADSLGVEYNISDELRECINNHARFIFSMTGPGYTDPQYGDGASHTTNYIGYLQTVGDWLKDPEVLWAAYDGKKGGKEPDFTSIFYPNAKQLVMRSDWTDDALYLYTNAKSADAFHEHWDDLGVIVSAYGEYLLVDPLHYTYTVNDLSRRWLVSSRGHNTIEINGHCQKSLNPSGMDTCLPLGGKQGEFLRMELNDSYDFTKVVTENNKNMSYRFDPSLESQDPPEPTPVEPGMDNSRSILFVRPNFWIVSDYMDPVDKTVVNTYEQLWHFQPDANVSIDGQYQLQAGETVGSVEDGELDSQIENTQFVPGTGNGTIRTNNTAKANIMIVPTSLENTEPKLLRGLYAENGLTRATYAVFEKNVQGKTSMDTILFPVRANQDYQIDTTQLELDDLPQGAGSAFKARVKDVSGVTNEDYNFTYYILHEEDHQTDVNFGDYQTDGTLAYYETSQKGMPQRVITQMSTYLNDNANGYGIFKTSSAVTDLAIEWNGSSIALSTSKDIDLADLQLTILAPNEVKSVTLNDEEIDYKYADNYVYFGSKPLLNGNTIVRPPEEGGNGGGGGSVTGGGTGSGSGGSSHGGGMGGISLNPSVTAAPTATPQPSSNGFTDVGEDTWFYEAVMTLKTLGIINGETETTFAPYNNVTRAEFTKMVVSLFGIEATETTSTFLDCTANDWYTPFVIAATEAGYVTGESAEWFGANENITREDICTILGRALNLPNTDTALTFTDVDQIADYALQYVMNLVDAGIINGYDDHTFRAKNMATRAEAAQMIEGAYNVLHPEEPEPTAEPATTADPEVTEDPEATVEPTATATAEA